MQTYFAIVALLPALALSAPAENKGQAPPPFTYANAILHKARAHFLGDHPPNASRSRRLRHSRHQITNHETYTKGSSFSFKTCEVEYSSKDDIDGDEFQQAAKDTVAAVISSCKYHQGTYSASGPEINVKKPEVKRTE